MGGLMNSDSIYSHEVRYVPACTCRSIYMIPQTTNPIIENIHILGVLH